MEWDKTKQRQEIKRGESAEGRRRGAAAPVSRPTACARGIESVRIPSRVRVCARGRVCVCACLCVCVCARARGRQMTAGTTRRTPRRSRNVTMRDQGRA